MSTLRWFRKNNKKILAIATAALAVAFLLPTFAGRNQGRDLSGEVYGSLTDEKGGRISITTGMLNMAKRQLEAMEAAGLSHWLRANFMNPEWTALRFPELGLFQILFSDNRDSQINRGFLYEYAQQGGMVQNSQELEAIIREINQLTGSEPAEAALFFILLSEEARRMGIQTSEGQIDAVLQQCLMLGQQGLPIATPQQAMKMTGLTETKFRSAVGDLFAILSNARSQTSSRSLSEPQLKNVFLEQEIRNEVNGTFVAFPAHVFRTQAGEPAEEQLQEQFEKYKTLFSGEPSPTNPFGFGYRLQNRVQTEYLRVDLKPLEEKQQLEFSALPAAQRDQKLQKFWSDNPSLFSEEITSKDENGQEKTETRTIPFDEAAEKARQLFLEQNALTEAMQMIAKAKTLCSAVTTEAPSAPVDYFKVSVELSTDTIPMEHQKTDFLSYVTAQGNRAISQAYLVQNQMKQRSLISMLFSCETLSKGPRSRLDALPVKEMETIGPLVEYDYRDRPVGVLLARIVAVDPEREPVSLNDDGSQGPASTAAAENPQTNPLRNRVKQDWINQKSYEIAKQKAEQFAQDAKADWNGSLAKWNESLRDKEENKDQPEPPKPQETPTESASPPADAAKTPAPADQKQAEPGSPPETAKPEEQKKNEETPAPPGPLEEDSLQNLRQMNEQLRKMAQQNTSGFFQNQIARNMETFRKAAEYAHEKDFTESAAPAVLEDPGLMRCLVFRDLQAKLPDEGRYLQKKPRLAYSLKILNQQRMTLVYFNPETIKLRNGFESRTSPLQDMEPQAKK